MAHVALMTIGLLRAPWGDPLVRGFEDRIEAIFAAAAGSPGFVVRIGASGVDAGPEVVPEPFTASAAEDRIAQTCSLWRDAESAFAFSYRGLHSAALRDRHDWFAKVAAPSHVAWWVEEKHLPTWAEAAERYAALVAHGATARAFDFRSPFDAAGRPSPIDRDAVRRLAVG